MGSSANSRKLRPNNFISTKLPIEMCGLSGLPDKVMDIKDRNYAVFLKQRISY
jgi:hypothetical protein